VINDSAGGGDGILFQNYIVNVCFGTVLYLATLKQLLETLVLLFCNVN
jgi:hypothetical protein